MAKPVNAGGTSGNKAPTAVYLSNTAVVENTAGAQIGTVTATDPNKKDTFSYQIFQTDTLGNLLLVNGQPVVDTRFTVDATGNLRLTSAVALDYETAPAVNLIIRATDSGGLFKDQKFSISVTNINEAPTDITLTNAGVNENAVARTVVATLGAVDQDAGSTFTYALVTGNGTNDAGNGLVTIVGNEIRVNSGAVIDYETNPVLNLNVRVTDNGGLSYTEAVTINVGDVNETSTETLVNTTRSARSCRPARTIGAGLRPSLGRGAPGARVRDASAWRPSERQSPSPARSCR